MREPYGEVVELDIQWSTKPVFKWDNYIKQYIWDHDETDKSHYVEFIGGKFITLEKGYCRKCGKKITPYKSKYFQPHYDEGTKYCFLFCADNFYCEECAQEEGAKVFVSNRLPDLVKITHTWENDNYLEIREYSDGSKLEQRTYEEMQQERARCGWKY